MKILRIVYDWPEPWSGLAPAPYFLSRSQGLLGHKITALTGGLTGTKLFKLKIKDKPEENVTVINLPRALSRYIGPFLTTSPFSLLVYLVMKLFGKVDLVHGHGHIMLCFNIYRLFFGWFDKTPYVAHFHICSKARVKKAKERREKFKFMQKWFENPLHELSDRIAVKVADKCIVVSKEVKKEFVNFYNADPQKFYVVESGVPIHIFFQEQNRQLSFNNEIIGVGVMSPRKGLHLLIEALKYLPSEYILRWIGEPVEKNYEEELLELAVNLNVRNRVVFEGYVPNLKLAKYFRQASIFVLPSSYEGFPKVVLEALACGIPVLASGFKADKKIRGLDYISSLAPKVIAKEIKAMLGSNIEVDVKKIHDQFSWNARAKEVDKIYNSCLKTTSVN